MKKVIKFLIVLLIAIIIVLTVILLNLDIKDNKKKNIVTENEIIHEETSQDEPIELPENTVKEDNDFVVFYINDAIQNYFDDISNNNAKKYYIQEVYTLQDYEKQIYYTYGIQLENSKLTDCYLKLIIQNELYSVESLDVETYAEAKNGNIKTLDNIEKKENEYNKYQYTNFSSKELADKYIKDYIFKLRYMPDLAYDLLENSYGGNNFSNIAEFKDYINKNITRFKNFTLSTCEVNIKEDSREYVVIDESNYYYKIIVHSAMDYKIVLGK